MISADLGPQLESFVSDLVESGRYNSKSEVVREGVRLIQDREVRLAALDASIAQGRADVSRHGERGGMIVHISAAAEVDLEAIGDHIARDNPAREISFIKRAA